MGICKTLQKHILGFVAIKKILNHKEHKEKSGQQGQQGQQLI